MFDLCSILTARNRSTADLLIFGLRFKMASEQPFKGHSAYIQKPMNSTHRLAIAIDEAFRYCRGNK
jgi:hypothetical protein